GIALKIAQLPPFSSGGLRTAMFVVGVALWIAWTIRYAVRHRIASETLVPAETVVGHDLRQTTSVGHDLQVVPSPLPMKHVLILAIALAPMAAYVYGALRLDWGFNELAGAFLLATLVVGTLGGLGLGATVEAFLEGAASLVSPAIIIGTARSISLVLDDGRIVDTIL